MALNNMSNTPEAVEEHIRKQIEGSGIGQAMAKAVLAAQKPMTLTTIEKAAKLMQLSYKVSGGRVWLQYDTSKREYNPYTNKADLVDVECALQVTVDWKLNTVCADAIENGILLWDDVEYTDHPNKFTARAHAVMAVVEQIYDRRAG